MNIVRAETDVLKLPQFQFLEIKIECKNIIKGDYSVEELQSLLLYWNSRLNLPKSQWWKFEYSPKQIANHIHLLTESLTRQIAANVDTIYASLNTSLTGTIEIIRLQQDCEQLIFFINNLINDPRKPYQNPLRVITHSTLVILSELADQAREIITIRTFIGQDQTTFQAE